ncbi:uncharacterized protein LOC125278056 isoform X2 [Megalobrama amblycephala]|uniref:uncharacterized protein LOC125278056 isoform X2 n=1 Tax=Megalobrama amblycephala TaxID=75352 RepID=UPI0020147532|nr:uncharacterized protein LOC125278056 isoform X2 [Megalobrama amblycephala]
MQIAGFSRTIEQIKNRWKLLKTAFFKAKSQNGKSGSDPSDFPFYEIIDSFMGERPIANPEDNGVDVRFSEDLPSEDTTNSPDSYSEDNIDSPFDEASMASSSSEITPGLHEETSSQGPRKRKGPTSRITSRYEKAIKMWSFEQQTFLEKMQETQNVWMEQQLQRNQEHEERLLMTLVEEHSRSNERLVGQLLSGLSGILHQTSALHMQTNRILMFRPHPQTQHSYAETRGHSSKNTPHNADTTSMYTFMNL